MAVTVPAAMAALATLSLASSLWQSQHMFHTSLGRNIRHLPCISRRTGEAGTCMFAFSCAKANGTHLGTCIDRFYFGSCCKMPGAEESGPSELDLAPPIEDNSLDGGTTTTNRIRPAITQGSFPVSPGSGMVATSKQPPSISPTSSLPPYTSSSSSSSTPPTTLTPTHRPASVSTPASWSRPPSTPGHWTQWLNNTTSVRPPTPSSPSSAPPPLPAVSSTGGLLSTTSSVLAASSFSSSSTSAPKEPTTIPPTLVTWTTLEEATGKPPPVSLRPQVSSSSFGTHLPLVSVTTTEAISTTSRRPLPTTTGVPVTAKPVTTTSRPRPPVTSPKPKPPSSVGTNRPPAPSPAKPSPTKPKPSAKPPTKPPTSPPSRPGLVTKPVGKPTPPVVKPTPPTVKPTTAAAVGTSSPTTTLRPTSPRPTSETWVPVNVTTHAPSPTTPSPTRKPTTKKPISSTSQLSTSSTLTPGQSTGSPSSTPGSTWSTVGVSSTRPPPSSGVSTTRPPPTVGVTSTPFPSTGGISSTRPPPTVGVSSTPFPPTGGISTNRPPPTGGISSTQPPSTGGVGSTRPPPTDSSSSTRPPSTGGTSSTQPPPTGSISSTTSPATGGISSTVTISTTVPVTLQPPLAEALVNMTNYKDVCGRRLFPESRVVGGDQSSFGKWPWQISLRQWRTSTYLHKCGAALLNENWAITAAHCVENVPPSDLLLRLGEHDLSIEDEPYGYQERRVQIVASHPQFDPRTFEYDLALLRFYEPVTFQPNIIPICVPEDDTNFVGTTAFVTGWGRLYEDGPLPSVLQEVSVPVINNTLCETMYKAAGYIEHIPDIFICAGWKKGGFDSCEGDSGGPMVIQRPDKRWLLAGVISWGIGCAEPNQPGVYTRISQFRHWINQILQF